MIKFTSTRKRSTVICQYVSDGEPSRLMLFCKGADTVILPRLSSQGMDTPKAKQTLEAMGSFAEDGLRTLCIGCRELPVEEYEVWSKTYEEATQAMESRQERVEAAAELIEVNLTLQGVTGIEDRLQDGVS